MADRNEIRNEVQAAWNSIERLGHVMAEAQKYEFVTQPQNNEWSAEEIRIYEEHERLSLMVQRNQETFTNLMETLENLGQQIILPDVVIAKNDFIRESSELWTEIIRLHRILMNAVPAMSRDQLLELVGNLVVGVSETRETVTEFLETVERNNNNNSQLKELIGTWGSLTGKIYGYLTVMRMALPGLNLEQQQQADLNTSITNLSTTYMPEWWNEFLENIGREVQGNINQYRERIDQLLGILTLFIGQIRIVLGYGEE